MGFVEDTLAAPRPDEVAAPAFRGPRAWLHCPASAATATGLITRCPDSDRSELLKPLLRSRAAGVLRMSKFGMSVQVRRRCSSTAPDPAMSGQ